MVDAERTGSSEWGRAPSVGRFLSVPTETDNFRAGPARDVTHLMGRTCVIGVCEA